MKTRQILNIFIALAIVGLLVPSQYVKAVQFDEIVQEVNFAAETGADEVQNALDDGSSNNYQSWDPIPNGVWFGGYSIENQLRMSAVPDDDFSIALATVCYFGSELIMSGASRTLVRLPIHTSDDPWSRAALDIYEIDRSTNWTFSRIIAGAGTIGVSRDDMKVDFTSGPHELIFWSPPYDPTDASPTDGNDHFTRSNRTYAFVDAPLKPNVYYLFITYVWFPSDKYVEAYIQPDSLDSSGAWNRSTISTYNEDAPDSYILDVDNWNGSCGYSFDFINGFGNSAYGMNVYMVDGDDIEFFVYIDPDTIDVSHYLTFMLPYRSTLDNVSWDITIRNLDPSDGSVIDLMVALDYICNDYILISMEQDWTTNLTAKGATFEGWLQIGVEINNNTRVRFPVWDVPSATGGQRLNSSWGSNAILNNVWDSGSPMEYNLVQFTQVQFDSGLMYNYHWMLQHSVQFNNFYWSKTVPKTSGTEDIDLTENMTLTSKIFFGLGGFLIKVGDFVMPISNTLGEGLKAVGTTAQIVAMADVLPDWAGNALDKLNGLGDFFQGIGQWVWRGVQAAIGFIRWFVETITYYASIILGLIVFIIAIIILFVPMYFAAKFGQIIVLALRGRQTAAIANLASMTSTAQKTLGRGGVS